jgi:mRNA interferase HigB
MHVISYKRLRQFYRDHADAQTPLDNWYKLATQATWQNLINVQNLFPTAEAVENFTVFNIRGNRYRLIVAIDYERQLIYVKYILTHPEYDKEQWKNDPHF